MSEKIQPFFWHFYKKLTHVNLLIKISNINIDGNIFEIMITIIF